MAVLRAVTGIWKLRRDARAEMGRNTDYLADICVGPCASDDCVVRKGGVDIDEKIFKGCVELVEGFGCRLRACETSGKHESQQET